MPTMEVGARADELLAKMSSLGVSCELERVIVGPQVSRYELRPTDNSKMAAIRRTADDIAFSLGAYPVRVIAPLPEKAGLIGIEVPSPLQTIRLSDLPKATTPLGITLGLDTDGDPLGFDLTESPHTGVAGTTGSGKSVCLNGIICQLIPLGPERVCFVMIDPKQVELAQYAGLPHLLCPVADTVDLAIQRLQSLVRLMEMRYTVMQQYGARNLAELNPKLERAGHTPCPYVVVVIDELADLMMASGKQVESLIVRLAQKARAVGIHLLVATQSPRVSVFTGLLKTNIPTRIAFAVPSMTDSRVILDANGAEKLLGKGDGLISLGGAPAVRFQGVYVEDHEIQAICDRWR